MLRILLNFLFPKDELTNELEGMTSYEFDSRVKKSLKLPDTITLFTYHDPLIHKALWELKYHANRKMASLLAPLIYEALITELSEESFFGGSEKPIVTTIPASNFRKSHKHFDQGEILLKELKKVDQENNKEGQFEYRINLLSRNKDTRPQSHTKTRAERLHNMDHAFSINEKYKSLLKNKTCIVLDDVTTTGATLSEARRVLEQAGARKVYCLAIAH